MLCMYTCIKGPSGRVHPWIMGQSWWYHSIFLGYPVVSWLTIHGLGQINTFLFSRLFRACSPFSHPSPGWSGVISLVTNFLFDAQQWINEHMNVEGMKGWSVTSTASSGKRWCPVQWFHLKLWNPARSADGDLGDEGEMILRGVRDPLDQHGSPFARPVDCPWRIHGAGIYATMAGVYWWDPWHTIYAIYSSTMDPSWVGHIISFETRPGPKTLQNHSWPMVTWGWHNQIQRDNRCSDISLSLR